MTRILGIESSCDETAAAERSGLTLDQVRTLARYEENGEALAE